MQTDKDPRSLDVLNIMAMKKAGIERKRTSMPIVEGTQSKDRRHDPDAGQINISAFSYPEIAFFSESVITGSATWRE
jgi:hypothetical protein